MTSYIITEEEYNLLSRKKKQKKSYNIKENDVIFISDHCKINKKSFIDQLSKNYDELIIAEDSEDADVIIVNDDSDLYVVGKGYEYEGLSFRNEEEWKLYISKINQKPKKKEENVKPVYKSYEDNQEDSFIKFEDADEIYYIMILDSSHTVDMFKDYINEEILIVSEKNYMNSLVEEEPNYGFNNDDIVSFLRSDKQGDWKIAIKYINDNYDLEDVVRKILPHYYSEIINIKVKEQLHMKIFSSFTKLKDLVLEPRKAAFSHYRHVNTNIKKIQRKTKIKIDKDEFLKSYLNE
jgi:hypothetical protein